MSRKEFDPDEALSDNVSGGLFDPIMDDKKPDGSHRRSAGTVGPVVGKFDQIAGLVGDTPTTMFVTSSEWARLASEIEILTKQINPDNFRRLILRNLTVVNSGSDDQNVVNLLNIPEARKCDFQNRRQRLISGRM